MSKVRQVCCFKGTLTVNTPNEYVCSVFDISADKGRVTSSVNAPNCRCCINMVELNS